MLEHVEHAAGLVVRAPTERGEQEHGDDVERHRGQPKSRRRSVAIAADDCIELTLTLRPMARRHAPYDRLTRPLVRDGDGALRPATWDEALERAADGFARDS